MSGRKFTDVHQDLLNRLVPVRPQPPLGIRQIVVSGLVAATLVVFFVIMLHRREDLALQGSSRTFLVSTVLLVAAWLMATRQALRLASPGAPLRLVPAAAPFVLVVAVLAWRFTDSWLGSPAGALSGGGSSALVLQVPQAHGDGSACGAAILVLAAAAAVVMALVLRRSYSVRPTAYGAYLFLAAALAAALTLSLACSVETFAHQAMWHFAPVGLVMVVGLLVGRLLVAPRIDRRKV